MDEMSLSAKTLLDSLTSGALLVSPDSGKIAFANDAFFALAGVEEAETQDKALNEFVKLPPKTECLLCQGKGESVSTYHGTFVLTASGEELRVKMKHSRLPTGEILCLMDPFSEDVTLTQAHSDFVSVVSHEFRTPLTSIKGFADTLLRYGAQLPADQQKRFISIIKDQADRLTRLVENLLTVSKLGASRVEMTYRAIPLQRMVEKVIQNLKGKGDPDRTFTVDMPPTLPEVWADNDKLEQVLLNLIDNAVKYSFAGTEVKVIAKLQADNPDIVVVTISDQGVGIPAEHLPRIFTKFSRIDNPLTREVEGTGLGLYITKSLTTAMGGEISVDSKSNEGTTFTLRFPVATAERQAAQRQKRLATTPDED